MLPIHSAKTDNYEIEDKIYLRREATKNIKEPLRVLDLFAGNNTLWKSFNKERYFGVEKEKGKGKNLNAENEKVIPALDLSGFNVIDLDSYGIPYRQVLQIYKNETLKSGTVIIYTAITNRMSAMCGEAVKKYIGKEVYKKAPSSFNSLNHDLYYGMLYEIGVKKITRYEKKTSFIKHYGYFTLDKT